MSRRTSAITAAGMVLSQPTMHTSPSKRWPRATSSIESAISSRETSDARMPSVPIETPSETAMVLNSIGVPPARRIPSLTCLASTRWFRLHGIVSIHDVATPTSGRARSAAVKPTPLSIARAGARSTPSVSAALMRFAGSGSAMDLGDLALVQGAQPRADLFEQRRGERASVLLEDGLASVHLCDPLTCERAVTDRGKCGAHVVAHVLVDDPRSDRVRAVLGGVGDRVVHALDAALPDQVDDQLQLVQALVIGHLGLVARFDERLEPEADQLRDAAAQDRLLAEEVGLRLLGERRLDHPRARGADTGAVGERELARVAARILRDRDHRRRAVALLVEPAHDVTRPLRRDHDHVVIRGRLDAPVMHVEPVREEQGCAG